ncbi:MAG: hypothetical protein ACXACP_14770, partial [Candidatus Hodarchaeales archaeon]
LLLRFLHLVIILFSLLVKKKKTLLFLLEVRSWIKIENAPRVDLYFPQTLSFVTNVGVMCDQARVNKVD